MREKTLSKKNECKMKISKKFFKKGVFLNIWFIVVLKKYIFEIF